MTGTADGGLDFTADYGSRSAVACALRHAEIDGPGADCVAILMGHDAGELIIPIILSRTL
jgi:hypothetical protein